MSKIEPEQERDGIASKDLIVGGFTNSVRNKQFVFNHTSVDHTRYESCRRAVYLPVIRNNLYPLFEQFDFPDPTMPTGVRQSTTTATQALVMMNDPLVLDSAAKLAADLIQQQPIVETRIKELYKTCLGRLPDSKELERNQAYIEKLVKRTSEEQAWTLFCQGVLVGNEFMYIQ